jgi:hypothetical protein
MPVAALRPSVESGYKPLCEEAMRCLALALLLSSLAITGAAAGTDLSHCLDPSTKLDAGGDVSDKELVAARQACENCSSPTWTPQPASGLTMPHRI